MVEPKYNPFPYEMSELVIDKLKNNIFETNNYNTNYSFNFISNVELNKMFLQVGIQSSLKQEALSFRAVSITFP